MNMFQCTKPVALTNLFYDDTVTPTPQADGKKKKGLGIPHKVERYKGRIMERDILDVLDLLGCDVPDYNFKPPRKPKKKKLCFESSFEPTPFLQAQDSCDVLDSNKTEKKQGGVVNFRQVDKVTYKSPRNKHSKVVIVLGGKPGAGICVSKMLQSKKR
jgi:hypothetical protein